MKVINISVNASGETSPEKFTIGHIGEHNTTILSVTVNESVISDVDYFRICFNDFYSDNLYASSNNIITYTVPKSAINSSSVLVQLDGYKLDYAGNPTRIFKSDVITAKAGFSLDSKRNLPTGAVVPVESALYRLQTLTDNSEELEASVQNSVNSIVSSAAAAKTNRDEAVAANTSALEAKESCTASAASAKVFSEASTANSISCSNSSDLAAASATSAENSALAAINAASSAAASATTASTAAESCSALELRVNSTVNALASKATTLSGYGITDAYTKTQIDEKNFLPADCAITYNNLDVWTSGQINDDFGTGYCTPCNYIFKPGHYRLQINEAPVVLPDDTAPSLFIVDTLGIGFGKSVTIEPDNNKAYIDFTVESEFTANKIAVGGDGGFCPATNTVIYDYQFLSVIKSEISDRYTKSQVDSAIANAITLTLSAEV